LITIDFETHPIEDRPGYPPFPVGVAIKREGSPARYLHWGSKRLGAADPLDPEAFAYAREMLEGIWERGGEPLLFHNAKFDLEVAEAHFGLRVPVWRRVHDTMFLAYLNDPHARSLGLKDLAAEHLDWPPEELDALGVWVETCKKRLNEIDPSQPATRKNASAWIWAMPSALVEPYALGDVDRAEALYNRLRPRIDRDGMTAAYNRERELMPILLRNEQYGMRLDPRIAEDIVVYDKAGERVEDAVRGYLRRPDLNLDADQDVAQAIISAGLIKEADFPRTDKGALSMSKEELRPELFSDPSFASALGYRNRLKTCLNTFLIPWNAQARANGGYITTNWNQVRGQNGGTRTGRPSTNNHNFLNLPKSFIGKDDGYMHPAFLGVPELPLCRRYILPDEGHVFLHRDYSGQELRVFAQAEQGALYREYQRDPRIDPHAWVKAMMEPIAKRELARTPVKVLNFQSIYGGGVPALQAKLRCTTAEAKALKSAHDKALPGRKMVFEEITRVIRAGGAIRTLGGRLFNAERPGLDGREKIYKLINYWVQGSAAELTKQAIIDWHNAPEREARFMVTVYDEINVSAPDDVAETQMAVLREVMEAPRFGMAVPMLSDGKRGPNWADLEKCE